MNGGFLHAAHTAVKLLPFAPPAHHSQLRAFFAAKYPLQQQAFLLSFSPFSMEALGLNEEENGLNSAFE